MTIQTPKQQAIFPDLPRNQPLLKEDGKVDDHWLFFFDNLVSALQNNYKPEGIVVPEQPAANLANFTGADAKNNILYDDTNNVFVGNINNVTAMAQFWLAFAMVTTYAGDPNTHVAGYVTELCLDTTNKVLYVCTAAGDAAGASWTST